MSELQQEPTATQGEGRYIVGDPIADTKAPDGPIGDRWADRKFSAAPGQPGQPPQDHASSSSAPAWPAASAAATLAELGYNVKSFCYQDSPRRAHSHRRAGRHQRRQELPQRRRQRPPAVLRHGQGRRLPRPRGQRLPPGRGQRQHHRPVRRPGRAVRPRVRRPARQPLVRRRAGLAHLLRPRPDGPAAAARRLPGARAADRRPASVEMHPRTEMLDLIVVDGQARGIVARDLVTGEIEHPLRRRRRARHRRLRQRLLPVDQRQGLQRHGDLAGAQARARCSPTPATRRSTRPASRSPATTSRS